MRTVRGQLRETDDPVARFQLSGQERVFNAWVACLGDNAHANPVVVRSHLDMARLAPEMAHVCVLSRGDDGFRFRIAGSGLRQVFGCDARGRRISEVDLCIDDEAWADASNQSIDDTVPVEGRTITNDGRIHFWLRLPMASTPGGRVDMVLCHDRFLPHGSEDDPEAAAKALDHALRLDCAAAA